MTKQKINYLVDYTASSFLIEYTHILFDIEVDKVVVTNTVKYYLNPQLTNYELKKCGLVLNGSAILNSIKLNNSLLSPSEFAYDNDKLTIFNPPSIFELTIVTELQPKHNKTCMGLFATEGGYITQCEPHGFSKITYYLDRPDVMSVFTTKITANKYHYPVLLSNGDKVKEEEIGDKKVVTWHDPFKKPSYLFALVAGSFDVFKDQYITRSNRTVNLEIYSTKNDISRTKYAMESLKRAMQWDEERFDLEYDLNTYMIVVTKDFNVGAMENKGLNIFNAKYVLADAATATDCDFINIESVIAHEYFHNWTGNRVTCRDWFQLSLKEGLTVFRDNEFTADLHGHAVTRINAVNLLRSIQFAEDASPLAHPVRPDSYIEINNFYTTTVYEKGKEVVRMYQTILGTEGFNRGLKLYIKLQDGKAARCEDFCEAMSKANNDFDLTQFMLWYTQKGTPHLLVKTLYDSSNNNYTIEFTQSIPRDNDNIGNIKPMLIPVGFGLIYADGTQSKQLVPVSGSYTMTNKGLVLLVKNFREKFIFENIRSCPVPSILRDFSAPVKLTYAYNEKELLSLALYDSDQFNRYEAFNKIFIKYIKNIYHAVLQKSSLPKLGNDFILVARKLLEDTQLDNEFRALCFKLPTYNEMLSTIDELVHPHILDNAINNFGTMLGNVLFDIWIEVYNLNLSLTYDFSHHSKRTLKNTALFFIIQALSSTLNKPHSLQLLETIILGQYNNSDNMTDTIAALNSINNIDNNLREELFQNYYDKWNNDELLMDKWFSLQATSKLITVDKLNKLMVDKTFISTNPNKIYALLRNFTQNALKFNTESGYNFIGEQLLMIEQFNPLVASSLLRGFSNVSYLQDSYKASAYATICNIIKRAKSNDVIELSTKIIEGIK